MVSWIYSLNLHFCRNGKFARFLKHCKDLHCQIERSVEIYGMNFGVPLQPHLTTSYNIWGYDRINKVTFDQTWFSKQELLITISLSSNNTYITYILNWGSFICGATKMYMKMWLGNSRQFCLGPNVLTTSCTRTTRLHLCVTSFTACTRVIVMTNWQMKIWYVILDCYYIHKRLIKSSQLSSLRCISKPINIFEGEFTSFTRPVKHLMWPLWPPLPISYMIRWASSRYSIPFLVLHDVIVMYCHGQLWLFTLSLHFPEHRKIDANYRSTYRLHGFSFWHTHDI